MRDEVRLTYDPKMALFDTPEKRVLLSEVQPVKIHDDGFTVHSLRPELLHCLPVLAFRS